MTLNTNLYTDPEVRNAATELAQSMRRQGTGTASLPSEQGSPGADNTMGSQIRGATNEAPRIAHNIANLFRSDLFIGDIVDYGISMLQNKCK